LAKNGAQVGAGKTLTYEYDTEIAKDAAEVLGECINLIESGKTPYEWAEYNYASVKDLTDHKQTSSNSYDDIFYTIDANCKQPGGKEAMMRGTPFSQLNAADWGFACTWGPQLDNLCQASAINMPTANYVDYAYGMQNGLPLDDPDSGWDVTHPFKGRDPRFYHDIIFDGVRYILADVIGTNHEYLMYATLYTGGAMRHETQASRTGYFEQKLVPHQANSDDKWLRSGRLACYVPYMRLSDVYLMYAEACSAASGCTSPVNVSSCSISAVDAINKIRARVGVEPVAGKYLSGKDFMDCVRRERACELAFEGFRFNDLQRWLLLTEAPYNIKTAASFKRVHDDEWYTKNDPSEAEVLDYNTTDDVIVKRNYTAKHYWFPFMDNDVYLYKDFAQNPGW
jgi:hypothetical protein